MLIKTTNVNKKARVETQALLFKKVISYKLGCDNVTCNSRKT